MLRKNYLIISVLCLLMGITASAQPPESFFPHQVGDMWEYYFTDLIDDDTIQVFVTTDSVDSVGNHHVTRIANFINPVEPPWYFPEFARYIVDTSDQVWTYTSDCPDSIIAYKLDAEEGDQWVLCGYPGYYLVTRLTTVREDTIFGVSTVVKGFHHFLAADSTDTLGLSRSYEEFADGYGLIYGFGFEIGMWVYLRGAVINGTVYGDTTLVAISMPLSTPIPDGIHLYQNYPNPFNPTTFIPFQLQSSGLISLIIYDVTGRLVRRVVDHQWYPAGEYEAVWDGKTEKGGEAASGMYFYQLIIGRQRATRPMLLIR